jgi:hypothetical protein
MLTNALAAKKEDLFGRPSIPWPGTRTEFELPAEFRWEGHWEVWEREWGGARWDWDARASHVELLARDFNPRRPQGPASC